MTKKYGHGYNARARKVYSCGKRRYRDEIQAKLRLSEIREHGEARNKMPNRAYHCPLCSGWHLTSQEKRTEKHEQMD